MLMSNIVDITERHQLIRPDFCWLLSGTMCQEHNWSYTDLQNTDYATLSLHPRSCIWIQTEGFKDQE